MDTKHVGARSELIACAWLLAEGYEVFRNISPCGLVDIIALKDGKTFFFDVKTATSKTRLSSKQIEQGILPLIVTAAGKCSINRSPQISRSNGDKKAPQRQEPAERQKPAEDLASYLARRARARRANRASGPYGPRHQTHYQKGQ
jgi:Holliday junction resolvase-like predicted endonuclease